MIAEVYPIKRMPRTMKFFDYRVPEGMKISRGCLVNVTLRGKPTWAIVRKIKLKPERGIRLKEITEVQNDLQLREEELSFFEWLAFDLAQSVSSILHSALPTPPKRDSKTEKLIEGQVHDPITLPKNEIPSLTRIIRSLRSQRECIAQVPDLKRMTTIVAAYRASEPEEKIVVIAPTVHQARELTKHLNDFSPIVITGEETNNSRYKKYLDFRSSTDGLLIGTKVASMLLDQSVTTFFVISSSDKSHKQPDRNPRFDVRSLLWKFHNQIQANLFFLDPAPRVIDLVRFPESGKLSWDMSVQTDIVDMRIERQGSSHFFLSYRAENEIRNQLESDGNILCVLNRKGVSAGMICQACSTKITCTECSSMLRAHETSMKCAGCEQTSPIPRRCVACKGDKLVHVAVGIDGFKKVLSELFPGTVIETYSKDSTREKQDSRIIVTTNFYLEQKFNPFKTNNTELIVLVDADSPLFSQGLDTKERAFGNVQKWRGVAQAYRSKFMIQTSNPTLFSKILSDPTTLYDSELSVRERYQMPPFTRVISIVNKDSEQRKAELELHTLSQSILSQTQSKVSQQKQTQSGISIRVQANIDEMDKLLEIFTELPDRYIIDTHRYL